MNTHYPLPNRSPTGTRSFASLVLVVLGLIIVVAMLFNARRARLGSSEMGSSEMGSSEMGSGATRLAPAETKDRGRSLDSLPADGSAFAARDQRNVRTSESQFNFDSDALFNNDTARSVGPPNTTVSQTQSTSALRGSQRIAPIDSSVPQTQRLELTMPAAFLVPSDAAEPTGDQHIRDPRDRFVADPPEQPPVARASLTEIQPYQEWNVHKTAADSLGRIGAAAVPSLVEALANSDAKRRAEAAYLLGHIGPDAKTAVPALVSALDDSEPAVQKSAARALGQIGPDAADAVQALMRLVETTEPIGVVAEPEASTSGVE